jgi:hypothetical protein
MVVTSLRCLVLPWLAVRGFAPWVGAGVELAIVTMDLS